MANENFTEDYSTTVTMNSTVVNSTDDEYYYYYEYDTSISAIPLAELVPVSLVYGVTLVIGVVGNGLVIVTIVLNRRMQSITNIFLTSLASADLLLVLLCVPIKFAKFMTFTWTFGKPLCKLVHYLQNVSVICSIFTMTAMSMERYYAIVHPLKAKFLCTIQRARIINIVVWFLSFILATPILVGQIHKAVGWRRPAFWCVKEWQLPIYSKLYETGMLLLIFILPLAIVTYAYAMICKELYKMSKVRSNMRLTRGRTQRQELNSRHRFRNGTNSFKDNRMPADDSKQRRQVIKMLVTIICLFAICWGPTLVDNTISAYAPDLVNPYNYGHLKYIRQAFYLMAYFNSCVNPIVYAFMSRNFREGFKRSIMCCCWRHSGTRRQPTFSSRTSTSTQMTNFKCEFNGDLSPYGNRDTQHTKLLFDKTYMKCNECETMM